MPFLPDIPTWENATLNTTVFQGLNRGLSIADGEMADMLNMTSDGYPVLSTRKQRSAPSFAADETAKTVYEDGISGMLGTDRLIVCSGSKVYMDGRELPLTLSDAPNMQPKMLVSMGAYVCIWPDKKYINVTDLTDSGDMGRSWKAEEGAVISAMMCRKDGRNYDMESITVSDTAPAEPEDLQLWLDTSGENDVLKQYSAIYQEWVQVATTFIKLQATGIGKGLKESDVVHIGGAKPADAVEAIAEGETEETLTFPAEDVELVSKFKTVHQGGTSYVSTEASFGTETRTADISGIPAGAAVQKAVVRFTVGYSTWGAKYLTANGQLISEGSTNEIPVDAANPSVKFEYKSYSNASVSGTHYGKLKITGIEFAVTYKTSGGGDPAENPDLEQIDFLNTTNIVYGCGDDYIIVAGLLRENQTLADTLTVDLKIPDLAYVCEANNRLWGCSYAELDGKLTNEIRCCALGDFRNWYKFEGTSMDSYVASVGSDGPFTGAFTLQSTPLFFKEGFLHKISGTQPSNFTLNTIKCRGVQDGSWRSLTAVNETLCYKARHDVMAYDGSTPYSVGEKLGTDMLYDAVGGAYRDKYYMCARDDLMGWHTYVLDTAKGLWHKEDEQKISCMASVGGELILALGDSLMAVSPEEDGTEGSFPWSVTFGIFGFAYERSKYLSRFNIRAQMEAGAEMDFEIMYDSNGEWEHMGTMRTRTLRTFMLPVIPRRCDHCQIRISGRGKTSIYSIARVFEEGGN